MAWLVLFLIIGICVLYIGGEGFVLASSSIALRIGWTPLVVGLTLVAYGTSLPEFLVSVIAAWEQKGDIVYGNVLGANIFNTTVILGVASVISPLRVHPQLLSLHAPAMVLSSILIWALYALNFLNWISGLLLVAGLIVYTIVNVQLAKRTAPDAMEEEFEQGLPPKSRHPFLDVVILVLSFGLLWGGARMMIHGAVGLARLWNISEAVIGLTIIAIGTSLPELAISVTAAVRKKEDLAIGNVVGSNIFRLVGILGFCGIISPIRAKDIAGIDFLVLLAVSVIGLVFLLNQRKLLRWEGGILLAIYVGYMSYLVMQSSPAEH